MIEAPKKTETEEVTKKRPRESEDEEPAPKLSKKQRKKLMAQQAAAAVGAAEGSGKKKVEAPPQKKQKVEGGKAVPVQPDKKEAQPNGDSAAASKKGKEKEKEKPKGDKKEKETGKNAMDGKAPAVGKPVRYPNGLIITDTKTGTGATAKKGSRLAMRYIGKFSNGTVFDSNTSGRPVSTSLTEFHIVSCASLFRSSIYNSVKEMSSKVGTTVEFDPSTLTTRIRLGRGPCRDEGMRIHGFRRPTTDSFIARSVENAVWSSHQI